MLMQLLLPSDEWYYTNHSTKYAKYVKYHAARILVYMGLLHKLGGRVDLFDRKRKFICMDGQRLEKKAQQVLQLENLSVCQKT
jgi:hypothetical protein